jgi:hypothetical protein
MARNLLWVKLAKGSYRASVCGFTAHAIKRIVDSGWDLTATCPATGNLVICRPVDSLAHADTVTADHIRLALRDA